MHNLFVIDRQTEDTLKHAVILIDTNVILDAWKFKDEFADLRVKLAELGCHLFTTQSVVIEFLGGSSGMKDIEGKMKFLEIMFAKSLELILFPTKKTMPSNEDIVEFSKQTQKFACTDFELYRNIKDWPGLLLMTRNHTDFTPPTFERRGFITLLGKKEIHTHGLYGYRPITS